MELAGLKRCKEEGRLEVVSAEHGLPQSVWETYSAFANTDGGILLLGVQETADHSLHAVGAAEPDRMVKTVWETVRNAEKVSADVLHSRQHVRAEEADGKQIVVIEVPRAPRQLKPVYLGGNPATGTYLRDGERNVLCSPEKWKAMFRDSAETTRDTLVLDYADCSVFCKESVRRYRQRLKLSQPDQGWESLEEEAFLEKLGAAGTGEDGKLHPTCAGLLMFGLEYEIVREFPSYFLDFREEIDDIHRWTDRFVSSSGDWSGNLFDFYFRVYNRIQLDLKVPFRLVGGTRVDDTPAHKAVREALANCLIHADYCGTRGIVIVKKRGLLTLANPGSFRIDPEEARTGGVSDPRNSVLERMFRLIGVGEPAGSGVASIFRTWQQEGWEDPRIVQRLDPDRTELFLPMVKKAPMARAAAGTRKAAERKQQILSYLSAHPNSKTTEIAAAVGLNQSTARRCLAELVSEGSVVFEGKRNRTYRLAAEQSPMRIGS